jgi:hypothetical protein
MTVMANYLIAISGHKGTNWQIKGTALACYTLATLSKSKPSLNLRLDLTISKLWSSTRSTHIGSQTALVSSRFVHSCSSSSQASLSWVVAHLLRARRQTSAMLGWAAQQLLRTV